MTLPLSGSQISGEFALQKDTSKKVHVKERLDTKLSVSTKWYMEEWFGKKVLWAGADITNSTKEPLYYSYYVAFFDADKHLIASVSQNSLSSPLEPGKTDTLGSCLIRLPMEALSKIAFYQVAFYEWNTSEKP